MENKILLKKDERIDNLEINELKIIQNKSAFCFGIDSVLLSDFAKEIKNNAKCVDLGTGTGILSILLCAKTKLSKIYGVEIQEDIAEMANRSIMLNHLEEKFQVVCMDIKDILNKKNCDIFEKNSFDSVITNPPYKKINTGKLNDNEKKLMARHEIKANLKDFMKVTNYLLKDKGNLYMVHRPERLVEILQTMRGEHLEPKEIRFVYPQKDKAPNLILIKAVKNGREFLKVDKPLFIYEENGNYTEEILKIYGKDEK